MKILALDQSSRVTGWAVFEDNKLIAQGNFTMSQEDFGERLYAIRQKIISLINQYNINELVFEDIQLQSNVLNNVDTFKKLAEVYGIVYELGIELKLPTTSLHPTSWKSAVGVKGRTRPEQKKAAQTHVQAVYGLKVGEDTSDAICIGEAYLKRDDTPAAADHNWD